MLRYPEDIPEYIGQPVGMVFLEKIRFADRQRINEPLVDLQIIFFRQRDITSGCQIAVGRTEGPVEVCM